MEMRQGLILGIGESKWLANKRYKRHGIVPLVEGDCLTAPLEVKGALIQ